MKTNLNLTGIILTKNNEKEIEKCLKNLSFCDELIVIDDFSKDQTCQIAEKYNAEVFQRNLNEDFAAQRNFGLERALGKWVLFIDSDEEVSKNLAHEIVQLISNPLNSVSGYYVIRKNYFLNKILNFTEGGNKKILRLAKKGKGEWQRRVHESWIINGKVKVLKNCLLHNSSQNLNDFISKINFYSSLHAKANFEEGKRSSLFKIIFWPKAKFIQNWIIQGGFRDGTGGFVFSLLMGFHSFLSWSKLWLWQKDQK